MSIFDTTLGERPLVGSHPKPAQSAPVSSTGPPAITAVIGERPSGVCPVVVDWSGLLHRIQPVAQANLPPAPLPAPATPSSAAILAAIDAALRQNKASVAVHGLFDEAVKQ